MLEDRTEFNVGYWDILIVITVSVEVHSVENRDVNRSVKNAKKLKPEVSNNIYDISCGKRLIYS